VVAGRTDDPAGARQRGSRARVRTNGKPFSVGAFTIKDGKIVECDFLVDPERLAQLDLKVLHD
jgi:hypothetical protein